ncbi:MAG: hypothetical protein JW797_16100 [Bradymonadales bacterium]|nr:hypothetical protein [Bradymonadales bacterium]
MGETYLLDHAYKLTRRVASGSFFSTYEGRQRPFDRTVYVRLYHKLHALGLSDKAVERLRARLEEGGDGELVSDFGEVPSGAPFVVLRPPRGKPVTEWWARCKREPKTLARLGLALLRALEPLTEAQRAEVVLDRVFVQEEKGEPLLVDLYCIGDHPTRAEVREMSRIVQRDLVLGFPPESFLPQFVGLEGVERLEAADVYRIAVILYQLVVGEHPLFPRLADVADAVAELINNLGRGPKPLATGSDSLDRILMRALQTDPSFRPSLQELSQGLEGELVEPEAHLSLTVQSQPELVKPGEGRRGARTVFRFLLVFLLLAATAIGTFLWTTRPPRRASVLVTSDPPGVTLQRIHPDGQPRDLGRTPLLLVEEDTTLEIWLRPIYLDGEPGQVLRITPDRLQMLDACRSIHLQFEVAAP